MAQELQKIHKAKNHKMITLDIKDLYVNLPKQGIIQATAIWMDRNKSRHRYKGINNTVVKNNNRTELLPI